MQISTLMVKRGEVKMYTYIQYKLAECFCCPSPKGYTLYFRFLGQPMLLKSTGFSSSNCVLMFPVEFNRLKRGSSLMMCCPSSHAFRITVKIFLCQSLLFWVEIASVVYCPNRCSVPPRPTSSGGQPLRGSTQGRRGREPGALSPSGCPLEEVGLGSAFLADKRTGMNCQISSSCPSLMMGVLVQTWWQMPTNGSIWDQQCDIL